ncbi:MIOREX complex component [Salix suchowensis]|nr:MIOREX complex component [Salix suchowensis]
MEKGRRVKSRHLYRYPTGGQWSGPYSGYTAGRRGIQSRTQMGRPFQAVWVLFERALRVCEAFVANAPRVEGSPRPFIYISAEDIFRPIIPAKYIETKREAEQGLELLLARESYRGVYVRPSASNPALLTSYCLPIHRLSISCSLPPTYISCGVLFDLSANLHAKAPLAFPTPSRILRHLASTFPSSSASLQSIANAMVIPPIHVDHVAAAACIALERADVKGVVGVNEMRKLLEWPERSALALPKSPSCGSLHGSRFTVTSKHHSLVIIGDESGLTYFGILCYNSPRLVEKIAPRSPTMYALRRNNVACSAVMNNVTRQCNFSTSAATRRALPFFSSLRSTQPGDERDTKFLRMLMYGKPGAGKGHCRLVL